MNEDPLISAATYGAAATGAAWTFLSSLSEKVKQEYSSRLTSTIQQLQTERSFRSILEATNDFITFTLGKPDRPEFFVKFISLNIILLIILFIINQQFRSLSEGWQATVLLFIIPTLLSCAPYVFIRKTFASRSTLTFFANAITTAILVLGLPGTAVFLPVLLYIAAPEWTLQAFSEYGDLELSIFREAEEEYFSLSYSKSLFWYIIFSNSTSIIFTIAALFSCAVNFLIFNSKLISALDPKKDPITVYMYAMLAPFFALSSTLSYSAIHLLNLTAAP